MFGIGGFEFKECGGVVVFWDNRVLQMVEMEVGNYSVHAALRIVRMVSARCFQECMLDVFRSVWALCEGGERGFS